VNGVASRRALRLWQINVKTPKRHFYNAVGGMAVDGVHAPAIRTNHDRGRAQRAFAPDLPDAGREPLQSRP